MSVADTSSCVRETARSSTATLPFLGGLRFHDSHTAVRLENLPCLSKLAAEQLACDDELLEDINELNEWKTFANRLHIKVRGAALQKLEYNDFNRIVGINLEQDTAFEGVDIGIENAPYNDEYEAHFADDEGVSADTLWESLLNPLGNVQLVYSDPSNNNQYEINFYCDKDDADINMSWEEYVSREEDRRQGGEEETQFIAKTLVSDLSTPPHAKYKGMNDTPGDKDIEQKVIFKYTKSKQEPSDDNSEASTRRDMDGDLIILKEVRNVRLFHLLFRIQKKADDTSQRDRDQERKRKIQRLLKSRNEILRSRMEQELQQQNGTSSLLSARPLNTSDATARRSAHSTSVAAERSGCT